MKHINEVQRQMQMKKANMKFELSMIIRLILTFDFIQSRTYNAFHFE